MRFDFGRYSYNDPFIKTTPANTSQYKWNDDYFNDLINKKDYASAANYAAMYHYNDPKVQRQHEIDIAALRQQGRVSGSIYNRLSNQSDYINENTRSKSDYKKFEFAEAVFKDGGLEKINQDNYYLKTFNYTKSIIGSNVETDNFNLKLSSDNTATSLSITFDPKRTLLGWDSIISDRDDLSFDAFLTNSGLTKNQLLKAGVQINEIDGKTTIKFDKSNPLANKIIYGMPKATSSIGYISATEDWGAPVIKGYNAKGQEIKQHNNTENLRNIEYAKACIDECLNKQNEVIQGNTNETQYYTSTIGGNLIDGMDQLDAAARNGVIDKSTYNNELARYDAFINSAIKTLSSGNYKMYTNDLNEGNDESLEFADNEERGHLVNLISATDPKHIQLNAMISNGQIGTLITIDAIPETNDDIPDDATAKDRYKNKRVMVFIPGFLQEAAQQKINQDTSLRTTQELNNMKRYGYEYELSTRPQYTDIDETGKSVRHSVKIKYDPNQGFLYGDNYPITDEEAALLIDEDMILEQAIPEIRYKFTNEKGEIYNEAKLNQNVKKTAIGITNYLFPDVVLTNDQGKPINMNNINDKDIDYIINTGKYARSNDINNKPAYETEKYMKAYEIFSRMLNELYYKQ